MLFWCKIKKRDGITSNDSLPLFLSKTILNYVEIYSALGIQFIKVLDVDF